MGARKMGTPEPFPNAQIPLKCVLALKKKKKSDNRRARFSRVGVQIYTLYFFIFLCP